MKGHILLVEDDAGWRETLARRLHRAGYQVTQAADGRIALDLLKQSGTRRPIFDVVLTDIVMGDVDGVEVTNTARKQPDAPEVILLTGHGSLETAIASVRVGAFDYLLKPCRTAQILERVESALAHRSHKLRQVSEAAAWQKVANVVAQVQTQTPPETSPADTAPPAQESAPPLPPAMSTPGHTEQPVAQSAPTAQPARYLRVGLLNIDTYHHEVSFDGKRLHTTPIEYAILSYLASMPERVLPYGDIARYTHHCEVDGPEARELLSKHVRNLRNKFDYRYLVSVRSVGYMLTNPDAKSDTPG